MPTNHPYNPRDIEAEAQEYWENAQVFRVETPEESPLAVQKEKFFCLAMFPYPSGQLHMGHVRCYTLGDVIGRYQRLKNKNVLQPMGWDAFGLPAENAAIKHGIPPAEWTYTNIEHMRAQMKALGFAFDWSREFATCDPDYYRWEQWFFTRLFKKGLVYRKSSVVNWDPVDQTVLANEQVTADGLGWRSGAPVERREMPQWVLKITDYAEQLLAGLDRLPDWPEQVKAMQRNWIGRSEGIEIEFDILQTGQHPGQKAEPRLRVFTTRPDTLMGATYVAVAPQHPLALKAAEADERVAKFLEQCKNIKAAEAEIATMDKLGRETQIKVLHPLSGDPLPLWVANFVLLEYGSGAVMGVPGHDQRDWEFAHKYGIDIKQVIEPIDEQESCDLEVAAFVTTGRLVNSGAFDGLTSEQAFDAIAEALVKRQHGRVVTHYRLRDWGVSRQRYWGCPIPVIYCEHCGELPVPDADLPVVLPTEVAFHGVQSPLKSLDSFRLTTCPECGGAAERETDTFDTFMESSWYYARFACPGSNGPMVDERVNYWTPVDHYVGGIEHAILHLLYARFFHKLMRDEGLVNSDEPFVRLLMLGMVLQDGRKMSKSAGDAGDPRVLMERYGADAVRTAMMFAAPPEHSFEWSEHSVEGAARFLQRLWNLVQQQAAEGIAEPASADAMAQLGPAARALRRKTHQTLVRADDDYGRRVQFNTVVSGVMELCNEVARFSADNETERAVVHEALSIAVLVISPIAPHIAHRLWQVLGNREAVVAAKWPEVDTSALLREKAEIVVQVNGKVRARLEVTVNATEEEVTSAALANENVARFVGRTRIRKVIYLPEKLLNLVVG